MQFDRSTRRFLFQLLAFGILLYCGVEHFPALWQGVLYVARLLTPFALGCAIAFVFNVPMRRFEELLARSRRCPARLRRPLAFLLTLVMLTGAFALAVLVVTPEIVQTCTVLAGRLPGAVNDLQQWLEQLSGRWPALASTLEELDWASLSEQATQLLQSTATRLLSSGMGLVSGIVSGVSSFIIGLVFSIYILFQKEKLSSQATQVLYALLPRRCAEQVIHVARLSNQIFSSFLSGQCLEAVILGSLFVVSMSLLRLPYAMLIGVLIAITALIPLVGAFVGCAVGVLLIGTVNPLQAVWFLLLFLVLQQLEGNLIYPRVVGGSIGLPAIWVLVAVTLGGSLFGILGILLFIPLCSVLYALFKEYINKHPPAEPVVFHMRA